MKKYLRGLVGLGIFVSILSSNVSAQQLQNCSSLASFEQGCFSSGGTWSSVYTDYAQARGIPSNSGGARALFLPSRTRNLDRVLYIVGPYVQEVTPRNQPGSLLVEADRVFSNSTILTKIAGELQGSDISMIFLGWGEFNNSELPTKQRVASTKNIIRRFERARVAALGRAPRSTALIGVSLGAVVGKIALRELEDENFKHGVQTYISHDGPHWGVYTPLALQRTPLFLEEAFNKAGNSAAARDARAAADGYLRTPVTQDIMALNRGYPNWTSPNIRYIRDRYRNLPRDSRNVAVVSGSVNGTRPTLSGQNTYFTLRSSTEGHNKVRLRMTAAIPRISTGDSKWFFWGQLQWTKLKPFCCDYYTARTYNNVLPDSYINTYERGECGYQEQLVKGVVAGLNSSLASRWPGTNIVPTETKACFLPTFSAIIGNFNSDGQIVGDTAFDSVIGNNRNDAHMATDANMDRQILAELGSVFPPVGDVGSLRPPVPKTAWPTGSIAGPSPEYTWFASRGATRYLVEATGPGNTFSEWVTASSVGCSNGTDTCRLKMPSKPMYGDSKWRVKAQNSNGESSWTGYRRFSAPLAPPSAERPSTPFPAWPTGSNAPSSPSYKWNATSGATRYNVEVRRASSGEVKISETILASAAGCASGTGDCRFVFQNKPQSGSNRWRIRAGNSVGFSQWSEWKDFSVPN